MARVGICEDDPQVRSVLRRALAASGHDVLVATSGAELPGVLTQEPELVVLDVGLPDADGRDLAQAARSAGYAGAILMLTALDGTHNLVSGLRAGADDYLTKPFDLDELEARVEALLRRTRSAAAGPGLRLDAVGHRLVVGEAEVLLTPTEFRLVARLTAQPGEVTRRSALVAAAWPLGAQVSENTLDSYVRRLRSKLGTVGLEAAVETVRGVGYRWSAE